MFDHGQAAAEQAARGRSTALHPPRGKARD